jgi:hypothetical protein
MRSNAYFWRNSTGHEIDLLIETGGTFHALEIKSGETLNNEFFKTLKYFKNISNLPADNLFLVYGGERNQSREHGQAVGWKNIVKPPYL